ncbi:MAG: MFS transporter [bacterium]
MNTRPNSILLYTTALLMDLCGGANVLLLCLFSLHVTQRESVIGFLGALMILSRIPFNLIAGPLSDRIGRRPFMLVAGGMLLAALWILGTAETIWELAVSVIFSGASAGLIWFNIEAALGDHGQGIELHRRTGNFNISFSIGLIIGPWLTAQIVTRSETAALAATAAGAVIITLCAMLTPLSSHHSSEKNRENSASVKGDPFFLAAILTNTIIFAGIGILRFSLPKRVVDLGYSPAVIGNLYAVCFGVMLIGFIWMKLYPAWHYRRWPLLGALLFGSAGTLLLGATNRMDILLAGLVLFGMAIPLSYYTVLFTALDSPTGRGRRSGLHESALAVGMVIGSQAGGILAESLGPQAPYGSMVFICVLGAGIVWPLSKYTGGKS